MAAAPPAQRSGVTHSPRRAPSPQGEGYRGEFLAVLSLLFPPKAVIILSGEQTTSLFTRNSFHHKGQVISVRHKLELRHLGPLNTCSFIINQFTVLTGPQANGKSTIAKAVYFFRSVKQDILNIMMQGGPAVVSGRARADWTHVLKQRLRDKFLQLFGTSWIMPDDMMMEYTYTRTFSLRVHLVPGGYGHENFLEFEFSGAFQNYLENLDPVSFSNFTSGQKEYYEKELTQKLNDPYETVFIPAGRNLITLLSTQLNYIFTSLEGTQLRNIDYITKRYTEQILKLKPQFSTGMAGMLADLKNDPEATARYQKHRPAIHRLLEMAQDVLGGTYRCVEGEERLYLDQDDRRYVKINFASSGQQEIVWVFNLLFYYLLEDRKVFLILEEPESHLYPASQQKVGEVLGLFLNEGNAVLSTTHSPYLLGTFNYMLLARQAPGEKQELAKKKLHKRCWLNPDDVGAYHIHDGTMESALDRNDGPTLIDNSLIDGASHDINEISDALLELFYGEAPGHE
jgi:hypothetical protein